ncbi:MAG TPA: hypothetical protein VHD81_01905 [Mycobacteriales bacterium]|nr:hypothetical protein [Mycobacteriales bacterium]
MRRTGRSALAQGVMALAVMAAGVIVVATDDAAPVANAETVLGVVKDAKIISPSGSTRLAAAGDRLFRGDVIMTSPHGSAQVITRQRTTFLGGSGALVVVNGVRQQLRTGTVVVDALDGPALDLDLTGTLVKIPLGSAIEASRGPSTRVGALAGPAALTSSIGRRLALPALEQVVLSGDAVPGATTPLHLSDSAEEARVVPRLIADDIALKTLARGIDTTGRSTARIVEASWTGVSQPVPNRVNRSERVLPVLIADSTHGGTAQQRYNNAVAWRAQGGSWGVVLHLLAGRAAQVESTLAALQKSGAAPGRIGTVAPPTVVAAGPPGPTAFHTPPVNPGGTKYPGSGSNPPTSTPTTSPPDTLLGGLVTTVQNVIDGVLGLLPHDKVKAGSDPTTTKVPDKVTHKVSTTTTSVATKPKSTTNETTQAPTVTSTPANGLLGDVLGGLLGKH